MFMRMKTNFSLYNYFPILHKNIPAIQPNTNFAPLHAPPSNTPVHTSVDASSGSHGSHNNAAEGQVGFRAGVSVSSSSSSMDDHTRVHIARDPDHMITSTDNSSDRSGVPSATTDTVSMSRMGSSADDGQDLLG